MSNIDSSNRTNSKIIISNNNFNNWTCLNDTIMGGLSHANCKANESGLILEGNVVENQGGFVSCRSELLEPPMNLSDFSGLEINIEGQGKALKLAISTNFIFPGIKQFIPRSLKWVSTFQTESMGATIARIPFNELQPNIRARKIPYPLGFDKSAVIRFQLLYSKFGVSGELNKSFLEGDIHILIRSIGAYY